jgi:stage II sporulation protein D
MSDDTSLYQAYFGEEQARAVYGDKYPEALKKITEAVAGVKGLTLCYEGEPVIAAFHGISFGQTESAFTMWGEDIPYLQSAESPSDAGLDICRKTFRFTDREISELIPELAEADIPKLTVSEQSEHGTALSLKAGDKIVPAEVFAKKLSLPSQHMVLTRTENGWDIETAGCGHLVGMSQYGANSMAAEGKTFDRILLHYYKDCVLVRK